MNELNHLIPQKTTDPVPPPSSHKGSRYYVQAQRMSKLPIIKNYGPFILTLFTITIFIVYAIKPTLETIAVLQKKHEDYQGILTQATQKVADLNLGKENYDRMDDSIREKIDTGVPRGVTLKTVITTLEEAALSKSASISAIQFQPVVVEDTSASPSATLAHVEFTYNTEGSYEVLRDVLNDLQQSSRIISINSVVFNKITDSNDLIMSVTGQAFYLK